MGHSAPKLALWRAGQKEHVRPCALRIAGAVAVGSDGGSAGGPAGDVAVSVAVTDGDTAGDAGPDAKRLRGMSKRQPPPEVPDEYMAFQGRVVEVHADDESAGAAYEEIFGRSRYDSAFPEARRPSRRPVIQTPRRQCCIGQYLCEACRQEWG